MPQHISMHSTTLLLNVLASAITIHFSTVSIIIQLSTSLCQNTYTGEIQYTIRNESRNSSLFQLLLHRLGLLVQLSYFPRPHCLYLTRLNQFYSFKHTYSFIFICFHSCSFLRFITLLRKSDFKVRKVFLLFSFFAYAIYSLLGSP
jgi:hypothetical protein